MKKSMYMQEQRWWVSKHEHGIGHEQHMRVVMVHTTLGQHESIKCELT